MSSGSENEATNVRAGCCLLWFVLLSLVCSGVVYALINLSHQFRDGEYSTFVAGAQYFPITDASIITMQRQYEFRLKATRVNDAWTVSGTYLRRNGHNSIVEMGTCKGTADTPDRLDYASHMRLVLKNEDTADREFETKLVSREMLSTPPPP